MPLRCLSRSLLLGTMTVHLLVLAPSCVPSAPLDGVCWGQESEQPVPDMTVEEAIEALRSPDPAIRDQGQIRLAAAELEEAKRAVPVIIEIIQQQAPEIPIEPMQVLAMLGPHAKAAVPAIVANLEKYAPDVQHSLLHVVAAIGPDAKAAVPSLIKVSTSQDFHCPYLAYRALGSMGPAAKPAVDTLIKGLQSNIASYRRNAAIALGRLGAQVAPEAAPALIKAIDDPLAPVRDEAILALSNYGALADPAVPRLRTILQDVDSTQRAEAAMTLWVLTKDVDFILPRITEHLQYGDLEWEAAQVLAIMGPAAAPAVPQLIEALARDESVQLAVLEALGNIGPNAAQALPAIRKLLDSDEPAVRVAAERAIRQIESPQKPQATF